MQGHRPLWQESQKQLLGFLGAKATEGGVWAGLLALENLPADAMAEAAIAAALLLEHMPQAVTILLRPAGLSSLVDAALDEAGRAPSDSAWGENQCRTMQLGWRAYDFIPL